MARLAAAVTAAAVAAAATAAPRRRQQHRGHMPSPHRRRCDPHVLRTHALGLGSAGEGAGVDHSEPVDTYLQLATFEPKA